MSYEKYLTPGHYRVQKFGQTKENDGITIN